ncbi:MAG: type II secretion system protein [Minisyncoccota bacterium]
MATYSVRKVGGFTLIELLVVISIIGFLSSTVLASVNSARNKADSAYRTQMVVEYIKALELFKLDFGAYPWDASITTSTCLASTPCLGLDPSTAINTALAPYIKVQPSFEDYTVGGFLSGPSGTIRGGPQYDCPTQDVNPNLCTVVDISYTVKEGTPCVEGGSGSTSDGVTSCGLQLQ